MNVSIDTAGIAERLRAIPVFGDLPQPDLDWLAERMEVQLFAPGEALAQEGDPVEYLTIVLEGEIRGQRENSADDGRTYTARTGQVTGMLPYSRLTHYPMTTRAVEPATIARMHSRHFPEMLSKIPALASRLVAVMSDRIREATVAEQQRARLAALGKLSAGLAHELNNPAAAAQRSAKGLRETLQALRSASLRLDKQHLPTEQRVLLARLDCKLNDAVAPAPLDSLERSDREEQIGMWLESQGVPDSWTLAGSLVDAGVELPALRELSSQIEAEALPDVIVRVAASFTVARLVSEIESSATRISELIAAVKEYSYMDRMPEQEVDLHAGIESTLVMLGHRLKKGITLVREYDRNLPAICAYGSELNQVWTNLIDNAIDAMGGSGELRIRTSREATNALVEIRDNGPGIPAEIRDRIFDPFFTTKALGEGTGLGLDVVYRIVQKHRGEVRVDSRPGDTRFQVRLPLAGRGAVGK